MEKDAWDSDPEVGIKTFLQNANAIIEDFLSTPPIKRLNQLYAYLESTDPRLAKTLLPFVSTINEADAHRKKVANSNLTRYLCSPASMFAIRETLYLLIIEAMISTDNTFPMESLVELSRVAGLDANPTKTRDAMTKLYADMRLNQRLGIKSGNVKGSRRIKNEPMPMKSKIRDVILILHSKKIPASDITYKIVAAALKLYEGDKTKLEKLGKNRALELGMGDHREGEALRQKMRRRGMKSLSKFAESTVYPA